MMMETLQGIKETIKKTTVVISLSPKITIEKMSTVLPTKKLARVIPNATSFINDDYNPVTFAVGFGATEKPVLKLLKKPGKTFETAESKLESYAMLPTYFWFQWQEMEKIPEGIGLTPEEAQKTVSSTLKIYYKSGLTQTQVMDLIP